MKYLSGLLNRVILLAAGVSLLGIGFAKANETVRAVTAVKAFVNGKIISLNSPVAGQVYLERRLESGQPVFAQELLMQIVNNLSGADALRNAQMDLAIEKAKLPVLHSRIQLEQLRNLTDTQSRLKLELNQAELATQLAEQSLIQSQFELTTAEAAAEQFRIKAERFNELATQGAISQAAADEVQSDYESRQNQVGVAQSKVVAAALQLAQQKYKQQQYKTELLRSQQASQTLPDSAESPSQQQAIAALVQDMSELQIRIREKEKAVAQLLRSSNYKVITASPGIVWEVLVQNGDQIIPGQPLVKLVDCQNLWVDAFVNIDDLGRVKIGSPAEVELRGYKLHLEGQVKTIRSYLTGTQQLGLDAAVTPPNLDGQQYAQIRIELDDVTTLMQPHSRYSNLCSVGQLATVKIGKGSLFHWWF